MTPKDWYCTTCEHPADYHGADTDGAPMGCKIPGCRCLGFTDSESDEAFGRLRLVRLNHVDLAGEQR